ncbi:zinc finger BED domain-containing protein 4-like [Hydra vulgaris]|uniref:zinc finger BED domain-containing protein 4-like n=1 Tax=Hydra vulgaris TaxID=6087 RepID=UPI0032EA3DD1
MDSMTLHIIEVKDTDRTSSAESVQIITSTATDETQGSSRVSNNTIAFFQKASTQVSLREILQRKELWRLDNPKAQAITKLIGEMICLDLQPYCIVEDKGFTRLLKNLAPNYTIPSRKYFSTKVIPLMYETIKAKVKYELDQADFLSLTSDGWTCQHTIQSYYSLTARFVTHEFTVKHVILQVTHFPESHTGHNISKFINEALQSWDIPHEKIHAVLTDNAANVMAAIKESNLGDKHLPCLIHTLQLCIQKKIFREQRTASDTIAVFRALARHFHHSSSAVAKLKEIQSQLKLPEHNIIQDVSTRWNSTYYMLERFNEQKKAITLYCITRNQANAKNPTENQWQLAEMLVCILKHFESTTKDMSKETACISEIIPFIYAMEKFLDYACDTATEIKTVVDELKKDFNCRFQKFKDNVEKSR